MDENISKNGRIQMSIIDNRLIELYQAGVDEERIRIFSLIREIIQEKDMRCDYIAVDILEWLMNRISGSK